MNVTFRQLRVFVEVATQGSVTRAAETLHLTPPAVSMQVKEVEAQVGLPLFDRQGRSVALSLAGEYFLVHAKKLLATLKEADDAMQRLRRVERGVLTIGMVTTAKYFVPHLLASFHHEHPGVEVRLRVAANREQLVALLQSGDVDLAVMGRPPRELATRSEAFAEHPLGFVCAPGHPLLQVQPAAPRALVGHELIVRERGSGTRAALEAFLAEHRIEARMTMELPSNETIKQVVIAGLGLSFVSLHTVALELRHGLLHQVRVEGTPVLRTWNVVHLGSRVLSPAAESFRDYLLDNGERWLRTHTELLADSAPRLTTAPATAP